MKRKVVVVTDSTANMPDELLQQYGIQVIPLTVNWSGESLLDGVALALANPYNWLMVLPAVELREGRFRYDDRGLVERVVFDRAKARGLTPEAVRSEFLRELRRRAQTGKSPRVQAFWNAIAAFSRAPWGIVFRTALPDPVPLGRLLWMRQPDDIIHALAIDSETTPRAAARLDRLAQ